MNKLEVFGLFLTQTPKMILYIIINILLIFFVVKLSFEPLGLPIIDEALEQVPWWMKNFGFIIIIMKNIHLLYVEFEKWFKIQGF